MNKIGMNGIKEYLKKNKWLLLAAIHFVASFLYEKLIFIREPLQYDTVVVMNSSISLETERVISYISSKILALIIICLIWKNLSKLFDKKIPRKQKLITIIVMIFGLLYTLTSFPDGFGFHGEDNYICYSYAIRNLPYYWHGMWTSSLYAAALMVFPHPVSLTILQVVLYLSLMLYIYFGLEQRFAGKIKYAVVLFAMLFTYTGEMLVNPYRNDIYGLLCLWMVAYTLFHLFPSEGVEVTCDTSNRKEEITHKYTWREIGTFITLAAFLSVWRTEGIIITGLLLLVAVIAIYRLKIRGIILCFVTFVAAYMILAAPQKIGDEKYFGRDYLIMSTFSSLQMILNDPTANLVYYGVQEDFAALEAICPVEWIKAYEANGYRAYNTAAGRYFSQSCASEEVSGRYMKAWVNIVLHNPQRYLKCQINNMLTAWGTTSPFWMPSYEGMQPELPYVENAVDVTLLWNEGKTAFMNSSGTYGWVNSSLYVHANGFKNKLVTAYAQLYQMTHLPIALKFVACGWILFVLLQEAVQFISWLVHSKKQKNGIVQVMKTEAGLQKFGLWIVTAAVFGNMMMVCLTAPVGHSPYYYPVFYLMFFIIVFRIGVKHWNEN